jgi:hypothetical protein
MKRLPRSSGAIPARDTREGAKKPATVATAETRLESAAAAASAKGPPAENPTTANLSVER